MYLRLNLLMTIGEINNSKITPMVNLILWLSLYLPFFWLYTSLGSGFHKKRGHNEWTNKHKSPIINIDLIPLKNPLSSLPPHIQKKNISWCMKCAIEKPKNEGIDAHCQNRFVKWKKTRRNWLTQAADEEKQIGLRSSKP